MSYQNLLVSRENKIETITVNRPEKLNALNRATIIELSQALNAANSDNDVQVVILTGAGTKAFVAGADISEFANFLKYNKHEIVLFYLNEPITEKDLEFDNKPYKFVDLETGEEIKLSPNLYQKKHKEQAENYLKELRLKCLQYKIDFVEVDINMGFDKVLNSYLLKRQKML